MRSETSRNGRGEVLLFSLLKNFLCQLSILDQRKCSIYILDMNFVAQFPFIMILVSCFLIRFFLSIFILLCINIIQYRYAECCTNTMDSVTGIYMYRFVFHRSLHLASHRTLLQDQYRSGWAQTHWKISLITDINSSDGLKSFTTRCQGWQTQVTLLNFRVPTFSDWQKFHDFSRFFKKIPGIFSEYF